MLSAGHLVGVISGTAAVARPRARAELGVIYLSVDAAVPRSIGRAWRQQWGRDSAAGTACFTCLR